MWHTIGFWFSSHEWVAIWLEGVALVLIFFWDRKDARDAHKETLKQIKVADATAEAAKANAQAVINAERAWLMASLDWTAGLRGLVTHDRQQERETFSSTSVTVELFCRNHGRSPAWIEKVYGRMLHFVHVHELKRPEISECKDCGYIGSLTPGQHTEISVTLESPEQPCGEKHFAIGVIRSIPGHFPADTRNLLGLRSSA